ncbi:MAG: hypothetical protein ACTSRA_00460 [Promethearchaeota archaeon]|nr:MAG: hypothetical protein [Helarchaeota virus Nidhogg Meg22_1012]URC17428.1 MAG: hypothetical protein [Helarchaeota virus Nidhogg Meg22_1214]
MKSVDIDKRKYELKNKLFREKLNFAETMEMIYLLHITAGDFSGSKFEEDLNSLLETFIEIENGDTMKLTHLAAFIIQMWYIVMKHVKYKKDNTESKEKIKNIPLTVTDTLKDVLGRL